MMTPGPVCEECLRKLREALERQELKALQVGYAPICPAQKCACGARAPFVADVDR